MAPVKAKAITLRTYRVGETSKVVVCYTREYGKVRLVAKGARKGGSRLGAALEPMLVSGVVFYLRPGRDLSLVSQAEIQREWPSFRRDVLRMAYAGAMLELVDALVTEREPDPGLFDLVERALDEAATVPEDDLDFALWGFELSLAHALGYAPELGRCAGCGRELSGATAFSSRCGGAVCDRCMAENPELPVLSGRPAETLVALGDGSPEARAGVSRDLSRAVRDQVSETLTAFLGEHSGRTLKLKALDFLSQVRRAERSREAEESRGAPKTEERPERTQPG